VLVTRPEPGATETAGRLDALGFDPVLAPAVRIRTLKANLPPPARVVAVLITSGQAIAAIPDSYRRAKLFAVGDATAARARQAGFSDIVSAGGDAVDLVAAVATTMPAGATLLLVTGQGLGQPLAASLRAHGFAVIRRSVYARCQRGVYRPPRWQRCVLVGCAQQCSFRPTLRRASQPS
jgi:uroporphyrinogen-III synthase